MTLTFNPLSGLGLSLLRQPMGSPDFALSTYSYDDIPEGENDFQLAYFSIDRDKNTITPYLKRALAINPEIKIMATPWSPPAWMKTGSSMIGSLGGVLRKECYPVYADYFVRFIQAYAAEGIKVEMVSPQNEIGFSPENYGGMKWSSAEEADFIGHYLGPALKAANLEVKILCLDHNWDQWPLAMETLSNPEAAPFLSGSAWHYYGGKASQMSRIHNQFPTKEIWFTEGSTGTWIGNGSFYDTFNQGMEMALEIINNWSKSIVWWNIALDEKNGPIVFPNTANYGLVQINTKQGQRILPNRAGWYTLSHFSRFVKPGALKVESETPGEGLQHAAFINPDGTRVLVLYNKTLFTINQEISWKGWIFPVRIPGKSAITCQWNGSNNPSVIR